MIPEFRLYAANCICGWGNVFSSKDEFPGFCPQCGMDLDWLLKLWTNYAARTPAAEYSPSDFQSFVVKERAKRERWPDVVYDDILDADTITVDNLECDYADRSERQPGCDRNQRDCEHHRY